MELYLQFTLFLLSIIVLFFFRKKYTLSTNATISKLPPGSSGWPIVGETWTYFSMAKKGLQYKFIADRSRKYSSPKIFKTSLLGETMAVMCTAEGNKFIFANENKLVQAWWPASFQKIFFSSTQGPTKTFTQYTKNLRKLVAPSFLKPQSLQSHVHVFDSLTKQHLQQYWQGKKVVKVQEVCRRHAFVLATRLFLSIEDNSVREELEKLSTDIVIGMVSLPISLPGTKYRRALIASREFRHKVYDIIKTRKSGDSEEQADFLSFLLVHTDENGEFLSEQDIGDKVLSFVVAAYETTSTTITSIIKYLAEHPQVYAKVLDEQMKVASSKGEGENLNWDDLLKMTYSWNVAREVLRLVPSIFGSYREAITDFNYEGFLIPKGWKLHYNVYATHKNPKYFPDPEKFDPSRFEGNGPVPYSYVPFGGGTRMCPGYEFSRLEILVFMHNLVTKYRFEKVLPEEKIVSDPNPAPTNGLHVHLYPH